MCDEDSRWTVNTDTGSCTTYVCESSNDVICMNEAQCSADMDEPLDTDNVCQCRDYNLGDNCQLGNFSKNQSVTNFTCT